MRLAAGGEEGSGKRKTCQEILLVNKTCVIMVCFDSITNHHFFFSPANFSQ